MELRYYEAWKFESIFTAFTQVVVNLILSSFIVTAFERGKVWIYNGAKMNTVR